MQKEAPGSLALRSLLASDAASSPSQWRMAGAAISPAQTCVCETHQLVGDDDLLAGALMRHSLCWHFSEAILCLMMTRPAGEATTTRRTWASGSALAYSAVLGRAVGCFIRAWTGAKQTFPRSPSVDDRSRRAGAHQNGSVARPPSTSTDDSPRVHHVWVAHGLLASPPAEALHHRHRRWRYGGCWHTDGGAGVSLVGAVHGRLTVPHVSSIAPTAAV